MVEDPYEWYVKKSFGTTISISAHAIYLGLMKWRSGSCRRVLTMLQVTAKYACARVLSYEARKSVKGKQTFYGMLIVILVASCKPALKVSSEYDKEVDFSRYRTFSVAGTESLRKALNQVNYETVLIAIRDEMKDKGFTEIAGTPDVTVNVSAVVNRTASISSTSYYEYGSVYRPYTWGPGVSYTDYDVRHYKDGTLIIDVVDVEAKKLLWQGVGKKEIDTPAKHPEKAIPKAVELIMAGFPPGNKR